MCSLAQAVPATPSCRIFAGNAKSLPSHMVVVQVRSAVPLEEPWQSVAGEV